jgi:hypothetical protein
MMLRRHSLGDLFHFLVVGRGEARTLASEIEDDLEERLDEPLLVSVREPPPIDDIVDLIGEGLDDLVQFALVAEGSGGRIDDGTYHPLGQLVIEGFESFLDDHLIESDLGTVRHKAHVVGFEDPLGDHSDLILGEVLKFHGFHVDLVLRVRGLMFLLIFSLIVVPFHDHFSSILLFDIPIMEVVGFEPKEFRASVRFARVDNAYFRFRFIEITKIPY